jgi:hypothetical protein
MSGSVNETLDDLTEDWAAVKLVPDDTGLPMAVWITENDGYAHDVRVKVATIPGGRGSWRASPSMGVRPSPDEIRPCSLPPTDVQAVAHWIELNREVILDLWNGVITSRQVYPRLRKMP